ncbi:kinase-like domain-containing protein [Astrocystis sublimbata]|nr:kinase-like domain-containing protein [Astrocystis sublimbata]KAI0186922.1 kinase-like domain-containing protein [Astrocystis sublimbata]
MAFPIREFPTEGFELIEDVTMEEELVSDYLDERYYPVDLGDVLDDRYQILAKLGYGTGSTIWLCRDLEEGSLLAMKVGTIDEDLEPARQASHEVEIFELLDQIDEVDYPGRERVRLPQGYFDMMGSHGTHRCLLFTPQGLTLQKHRDMVGEWPKGLLQLMFESILTGVEFLHQIGIVHTGTHADLTPSNILLEITDQSVFEEMEQRELHDPSPRKVLPDRTIYVSQTMPLPDPRGLPIICDFGGAKVGLEFDDDAMPDSYRAPEIILKMNWDESIDMWSIGVMLWDLFEDEQLFRPMYRGQLNDELHLAQMVSLMGPPPSLFLERSEDAHKYWDAEGNWIAATRIPNQSFESREHRLEGADQALLLAFLRRVLCWLPEERASAKELLEHEFILQHNLSNGYH